jgi:phosphoenolpyruvate carboxylase
MGLKVIIGDRDGNPFVVASFTNQTFIEQKEFVLRQYVDTARLLVDKLTPSTSNIIISDVLKVSLPFSFFSHFFQRSLAKDKKLFPYLTSIKPQEPYRAKMRYIQEKLENTLQRVSEVKKQAGETIKPLLGLTLPGPSGYNRPADLQNDLDILYESLLHNGGKAQARSLLQDFHILVSTFKLHMTAIDFRQTSEKNTLAVVEFLNAVGHSYGATLAKMPEKDKTQALLELLVTDDLELSPWTINALSKISKDTFETFLIFADAAQADPNVRILTILRLIYRLSGNLL